MATSQSLRLYNAYLDGHVFGTVQGKMTVGLSGLDMVAYYGGYMDGRDGAPVKSVEQLDTILKAVEPILRSKGII